MLIILLDSPNTKTLKSPPSNVSYFVRFTPTNYPIRSSPFHSLFFQALFFFPLLVTSHPSVILKTPSFTRLFVSHICFSVSSSFFYDRIYQIRQHDQLPFGSLPVVHNSPYGVINLRWESTKKQRKFGTLDPSKIIWKLPQKKQAINHFTSQFSTSLAKHQQTVSVNFNSSYTSLLENLEKKNVWLENNQPFLYIQ